MSNLRFNVVEKAFGKKPFIVNTPDETPDESKFAEIRYNIDKLELIVDDRMWPLPKYRELLFIR